MQETEFIWMDGKFVKWEDAKIHVLAHALHYGSGVFEGIRVYETEKGGAVFRLKEHIARLFKSAECFKMNIPYTEEELIDAVKETLRVNKLKEAYIRPIIFFGYGEMGLRNIDKAELNVVIAAWPWPKYLAEGAIKVKVSKIRRIAPETLKTEAKVCGHYVNSILATMEAAQEGYDEALLLDLNGKVCEGPGENVFIIKDKKIMTPGLGKILSGITRDAVIKVAKDKGYEVEERELSLEDVNNADEVFMTGTAAEVTAIGQVDDKVIGNGEIEEITSEIRDKFLDIVHGRDSNYEEWLDYL